MNQTGLKTFIAIVETGSLVKASDRLVSHNHLSRCGSRRWKRSWPKTHHSPKSGVTLTAAGTKLLSYAQVIDGL